MYRPIIRAKAGELEALANTTQLVQSAVVPVLEFPPREFDFENGEYKRTLEDHVTRHCSRVKSGTIGVDRVLVDTVHLDRDKEAPKGTSALQLLCDAFRSIVVAAAPVLHLDTRGNTVDAARQIHRRDGRGIALRLNVDGINRAIGDGTLVEGLLKSVSVSAVDVDLILDLGSVVESFATAELIGRVAIEQLNVSRFRSVSIAASSVPPDVSGVEQFKPMRLPRNEWQLWRRLRESLPTLIFGDFGTQSPGQEIIDMRNVVNTMRAKCRYTIDDHWLVVAGRSFTEDPEQFCRIATMLCSAAEFSGSDFSWGDAGIQARANRTEKAGNLQTWVGLTTNHHLHFITDRLANPRGT